MDPHLEAILECFGQWLDQHFITTNSHLTTTEGNYQELSDTICHLTESSPSLVASTPSMTQEEMKTILEATFYATYQMTLDSFSRLHSTRYKILRYSLIVFSTAFDFYRHLCQLDCTICFFCRSSSRLSQLQVNWDWFPF